MILLFLSFQFRVKFKLFFQENSALDGTFDDLSKGSSLLEDNVFDVDERR